MVQEKLGASRTVRGPASGSMSTPEQQDLLLAPLSDLLVELHCDAGGPGENAPTAALRRSSLCPSIFSLLKR